MVMIWVGAIVGIVWLGSKYHQQRQYQSGPTTMAILREMSIQATGNEW